VGLRKGALSADVQSEPVGLSVENLVQGKPRMQLMLLVIPAAASGLRGFECKI